MASIVTKTGDTGTTSLYGGERLPKHAPRLEAYGAVDELNACVGAAIAECGELASLRDRLTQVQHLLFRLGGDLATPLPTLAKRDRIAPAHTAKVEGWIRALEAELPAQRAFLLPGGSKPACALHLARTVCRRAERRLSALAANEDLNGEALVFLNRLGDYLFLAARKANIEHGVKETEVEY